MEEYIFRKVYAKILSLRCAFIILVHFLDCVYFNSMKYMGKEASVTIFVKR